MKDKLKIYLLLIGVFTVALTACTDYNTPVLDYEESSAAIAIPLVNTKISPSTLAENTDESTSILIDEEGKVTVIYSADVIRRTSLELFVPVPGFVVGSLPITDTVAPLELPIQTNYIVNKGIFSNTNVWFSFTSPYEEDIDIKMRIKEFTKDGEIFEVDFRLTNGPENPDVFTSQPISLNGYTMLPQNNMITFDYDARLPNGERVRLDDANMSFDLFLLSYVEGLFGERIFPIDADIITVGIFENWISGGILFDDPKVTLRVDNSFGLPTTSKFERLEIHTVSGEVLSLQSTFLEEGVSFAYPELNEVGEVKSSYFEFNGDNSNIGELFRQRPSRVVFDFDALINGEDPDFVGFSTDSSYFLINVAVEVPLQGVINDLVIADTTDLDVLDYEEVESAQFKMILSNDFPIDVLVQGYFLDENTGVIDSLFSGEGLLTSAATLQPNGTTEEGTEMTTFIDFSNERYQKIKSTKRFAVKAKFSQNSISDGESVWIYDNDDLELRLGGIFNLGK